MEVINNDVPADHYASFAANDPVFATLSKVQVEGYLSDQIQTYAASGQ